SAGHGPILLRCGVDHRVEELTPPEMPLGVSHRLTGDPAPPARLEPGGSVAIISDGIFEAMNGAGEQFGMERVIEHLDQRRSCSPQEVISTLRDATNEWTGGAEPADDQTIVAVRRVASTA